MCSSANYGIGVVMDNHKLGYRIVEVSRSKDGRPHYNTKLLHGGEAFVRELFRRRTNLYGPEVYDAVLISPDNNELDRYPEKLE